MKGVVFTEFIEMVEEVMSPEMADELIESCDLPSNGIYTAVGSYDHAEILALVSRLSELSNTPVPTLVAAFGKHLLSRFTQLYPDFFTGANDTFSFLDTIENHVHVEVQKLYPDAELPTFTTSINGNTMTMEYKSKRPFADLAEGLILGTAKFYNENIRITRTNLSGSDATHELFTIERY